MKVLLYFPEIRDEPPIHCPYTLLQLATITDELGFKVKRVFDNNAFKFPVDAVRQSLKDEGALDVICISGLTKQYKRIKDVVKLCREEHPAALIVGEGAFITAQPFDMMRWLPEFDIGCIGESYNTWREILEHVDDKQWNKVKGLVYREGKKVKLSSMRPLIDEFYYCEKHQSKHLSFAEALEADFKCKTCSKALKNNMDEQIPYPAYEFSPIETYLKYSPIPYSAESSGLFPLNTGEGLRRLDVMASLGCDWNCYFCFLPQTPSCQSKIYGKKVAGKAFRQHSPQYVVRLIDHLRRKYGINFVSFIDENFTTNRPWFFSFCKTLEEADLATLIHWGVAGHSCTVDSEMLSKGHDVGMSYISFGGESASPRLLDEIGKGQTPKQMVAAIEAAHAAQINTIMSFIVGFPGETIDDTIATAQFFVDNQIHWEPSFLQPYPGTKLYEEYKDKIIEQHTTDDEKIFLAGPTPERARKLFPEIPESSLGISAARKRIPEISAKIHDKALERWVLSLDDATRMSCNLTDFTDVELAGLKYMLFTWDVDRLKRFKKILERNERNE